MKRLKNIALLCSAILMFTSCASDWLDTKPTSAVGMSTAFESTDNAAMAINGLCKMMSSQYLSSQGFNGEGTIKMYYGNYPSSSFFVNLPGSSDIINCRYMDNTSSAYDYYPWYYYYKLIANANAILHYIDEASGTDEDKDFIRAQAYTFRAYSFFMLSQIYGNRWIDSNGGSTDAIVLRTDMSDGDIPLSTLKETYEQIYADLDEAIRLYKSSGKDRPSDDNYSPNLNVAYATYARAALTRQNYEKAKEYAVLAREGYPLMNTADYKAGFHTPNSEWIWSCFGASEETLFYYSYFAYIAYNSSASAVRSYPKCISRELYNQIPETDIRRELFLDPKEDTYTTSTGNAGSNTALYKRAFAEHPDLNPNSKVYAYMQFKISAKDQPGVGNLNNFRSSEMYLIEAEAEYFLNNEPAAQTALNTLTRDTGRDPEYNCTKSGEELLTEIKKYRSIELWGEGFEWFDLKRWGDPIVRHTYEDGGNFITVLAITINPGDSNKWTWRVPLKETDYNHAIGANHTPESDK